MLVYCMKKKQKEEEGVGEFITVEEITKGA